MAVIPGIESNNLSCDDRVFKFYSCIDIIKRNASDRIAINHDTASSSYQFLLLLNIRVAVFKCLGHFLKKSFLAQFCFEDPSHIYFTLPRNFGLNVLHSFENIAKTLSVTLEVSISIFRHFTGLTMRRERPFLYLCGAGRCFWAWIFFSRHNPDF